MRILQSRARSSCRPCISAEHRMASSEAPDPNPHVPQYIVPALACDAHCHVFGPAATFPYAPNRAYTPQDAPRDRLAALHAALRIERAVIVQASCHGKDNRAMLDAIAHSGGRYRGVAIVDESFEDADYVTLHEGRQTVGVAAI